MTIQAEFPSDWTLANLQARLAMVSAARIRLFPPPVCANEETVAAIQAGEDGALDGGIALPGFEMALRALFAEADRQGPRESRSA